MPFDKTAERISKSVIQTVKTNSVINALLVLTGIVTPLSFILAAITGDPKATFFLYAGSIPPAGCLIAYAYFSWRDPVYLRSESFQFRQQALQFLGDKYKPLITLEQDIRATTPPVREHMPQLLPSPPENQPGDQQ